MKLSKEILREINFAISEYKVMQNISDKKKSTDNVKTHKDYSDFYYALYAYHRSIIVACEIYQKYGIELEPREFCTKKDLDRSTEKANELFNTFQFYKNLVEEKAVA